MKKIGLVLEGGANRGIFTAGVLDCFQENALEFFCIISVSVGTCNAIDYISKQPGRTRKCFIPSTISESPISCMNILKKGTIIDLDLVFDEYPNHIFPFDYDTFGKTKIYYEFVVTNVDTGKAEYLKPNLGNNEELMRMCRASCSMPFILPEITINNKVYLDGGALTRFHLSARLI